MTNETDSEASDWDTKVASVLMNALTFVANEPVMLAQLASITDSSDFPDLVPDGSSDAFDRRMDKLLEHLGGPPRFRLIRDDQQPPPADNYPEAAMREAFAVFDRARKSVMRAKLFQTGASLLENQPDLITLPEDVNVQQMFFEQTWSVFWEHAEAAYIRLYAFWDRVGQILDFAFFNIRKFDQNGFTAVVDRIHANAVPMEPRLKESAEWQRLRAFQTSEREDGLKWLLQRRNLMVHSLHLHPIKPSDEGMFTSQFNHLEVAHREKLRPRSPSEECAGLIEQLKRASALFPEVLGVLERAPRRNRS